jgi:2-polyprenyl-3-methyl-5-hydroxy-6-metoxy-1,4-benzoquinol methylase
VPVADHCRDSPVHAVVQCQSCRLIQLSPTPSSAEHNRFHSLDLQSHALFDASSLGVVVARKVADTARRIAFLHDHIPTDGSVLDVGSGYGVGLAELAEEGYRVTGVELSDKRRSISQQLSDVPVVSANLFDLPQSLGRFDTVLLTHVLEHLVQPVSALEALGKSVAPGGCLIVEVPNVEDLSLDASEGYRAFYWQQAHVSYFSSVTLELTLRNAGFGTVSIEGVHRYGLENLMSWLTTGRPQLPTASFHTTGPYRWLEDLYKEHLQQSLRCDTLVAVARV